MIKKAEYVAAAWISLMIKKNGMDKGFELKNVVFKKEEIIEEANRLLPNNKTVTGADFNNLVIGRGSSVSNKYFIKCQISTMQDYYMLGTKNDNCNYNIDNVVEAFFKSHCSIESLFTVSTLKAYIESYYYFLRQYNFPIQREYTDIITRDAIWLATTVLTYNEWIRLGIEDQEVDIWLIPISIRRAAVCFNSNISFESCSSMIGTTYTVGKSLQGFTYFTANGELRRITRIYEAENTIPDIRDDYEICTINGIVTSGFLKSFIINVYSGKQKYFEAPLDISASNDEQIQHAKKIDNYSLYQAAMQRSRMEFNPYTETVTIHHRDAYIAQYAKRLAKGKCRLCDNDAPFKTINGEDYLEAHHIMWLSKDGKDALDNVVALCPNCHRKMHMLDLEEDKSKLIEIAQKQTSTDNL